MENELDYSVFLNMLVKEVKGMMNNDCFSVMLLKKSLRQLWLLSYDYNFLPFSFFLRPSVSFLRKQRWWNENESLGFTIYHCFISSFLGSNFHLVTKNHQANPEPNFWLGWWSIHLDRIGWFCYRPLFGCREIVEVRNLNFSVGN